MKEDTFPNFPNWLSSKYPDSASARSSISLRAFGIEEIREEYDKELEQWELGD